MGEPHGVPRASGVKKGGPAAKVVGVVVEVVEVIVVVVVEVVEVGQ